MTVKKLSTTYKATHIVDFLIDDDKEMMWIARFNSDKHNRFFVVIDKNVNKIWGSLIRKKLKYHKKKVFIFEVEALEKSKSLSFYPRLVNFLELHKCNLSDLVMAIGGGTIIDLVSFTCSTYMRGLPFVIIATTLTGIVDASTAGKTCLNTTNNKNILGTFYYPLKVYNNIHFLKTCSRYYHRQGLSEVFKYGLLDSKPLLDSMAIYLSSNSSSELKKMIEFGFKARINIRKKHPQASNLGHTFGHAIEKLTNYKTLHGDAISVGIVIALYFAQERGIMGERKVEKIIKMMKQRGLSLYLETSLNVDDWVRLMMSDKKSSSKALNLVLLTDIAKPYKSGNSYFYRTKPAIIKRFLRKFVKDYYYIKSECAIFLKREKLVYKE